MKDYPYHELSRCIVLKYRDGDITFDKAREIGKMNVM